MTSSENIIEVEYPDIEGFKLKLAYLTRDDLMKIRKQCLTFKFNKRTRQREEDTDSDKFLEIYSKEVIKGWHGLTIGNLVEFLPVNISEIANPGELIPYSEEEALDLLKNSSVFDQYITDCMNDFELFSIQKKEKTEKN